LAVQSALFTSWRFIVRFRQRSFAVVIDEYRVNGREWDRKFGDNESVKLADPVSACAGQAS
jgi:hypothetical protein